VCDAFTVSALLAAMSTRRDLLLEMVALRHQLAVLGRSNRRFRLSDRVMSENPIDVPASQIWT